MTAALRRLFNKRRIGGKHTEEKNLFLDAKHLSKEEQRQFEDDYKLCVNNGLILKKKSTGEWHISLNPRKLAEILQVIQ